MAKTPEWSFNINGFTRRASQLSVTEFGVFWLLRFSEEDLQEWWLDMKVILMLLQGGLQLQVQL